MRRLLAAATCAGLLAASSCGNDGSPGPSAARATTTSSATTEVPLDATPLATTSSAPAAAVDGFRGLASDEPCTRTVDAGALPAPVPVHLEDLQRMVLDAGDVGGLDGFERDPYAHGYWGNAELDTLEIRPTPRCEDSARFGRINGYANAWVRWAEGPAETVTFAVHLFGDEAGAAAWIDAYLEGLDPAGPTGRDVSGFTVADVPELGAEGRIVTHAGPDGTCRWAMYRRGPVVGWVVDTSTDAGAVDVLAAGVEMAERTGVELAAAEARPAAADGSLLDAARLLSAPLPLVAFGPAYAGLRWDAVFGGCADTEERRAIAGDDEAADAERFGRIVGCTAMYAPAQEGAAVERVMSSVTEFADAAGASGYLADTVAEMTGSGGTTFTVTVPAAEAGGVVTPPGGDRTATDTRVLARVGTVVASVVVQRLDDQDVRGAVAALAGLLVERVTALLGGG